MEITKINIVIGMIVILCISNLAGLFILNNKINSITISNLVNHREYEMNGLRWECKYEYYFHYENEDESAGVDSLIYYGDKHIFDGFGGKEEYHFVERRNADDDCTKFVLTRSMR